MLSEFFSKNSKKTSYFNYVADTIAFEKEEPASRKPQKLSENSTFLLLKNQRCYPVFTILYTKTWPIAGFKPPATYVLPN